MCGLDLCCCLHYCWEAQQTPPHPPQQQYSKIDSLYACAPTFHSDHFSPSNFGLPSCLPLCFPLASVLALLSFDVFASLA